MFGKNASSNSNANVAVNVTLDLSNATFSGVTTFDSSVINNSTLTQVGDANFNNINIEGTLTYSNFTGDVIGDVTGDLTGDVTGDVTGNLTGNVTGNVTGNLTGKLFAATNGSISSKNFYDIVYDVNGPNIGGFTSHYFNCNSNLVLAINEYSVNSIKHFYCVDTVYSTGLTNSTTAITNNSTLLQVGTSTFTGAITANGVIASKGIINSTQPITNNSTLAQVGTSTFTGAITANAGFKSNSPTSHYCLGGDNYFDSTAITAPKVNNGIASGTADGASFSTFNNAINSWFGTGFIDTFNETCNAVINHRTGDISTNGTVYTPIISGTNGLQLNTLTGIHNFKIGGVQKVYINNTDLTNTVNLTQIGSATFTNTIYANGGVHFGDANSDTVKIIKSSGGSDVSELSFTVGDNGTSTSTISLPIPQEAAYTDYVTVRSTNAGVHHSFSSTGNYYYGNSLVPSYASLPTLTTLQIGGSASASFSEGLLNSGYHNTFVTVTKGYYIVIGFLDVSQTSQEAQYINYGLGYYNSYLDPNLSAYKNLSNFDREYLPFNYYVSPSTTTTYYFTMQSNINIYVYKSKCTFIRIA